MHLSSLYFPSQMIRLVKELVSEEPSNCYGFYRWNRKVIVKENVINEFLGRREIVDFFFKEASFREDLRVTEYCASNGRGKALMGDPRSEATVQQ